MQHATLFDLTPPPSTLVQDQVQPRRRPKDREIALRLMSAAAKKYRTPRDARAWVRSALGWSTERLDAALRD